MIDETKSHQRTASLRSSLSSAHEYPAYAMHPKSHSQLDSSRSVPKWRLYHGSRASACDTVVSSDAASEPPSLSASPPRPATGPPACSGVAGVPGAAGEPGAPSLLVALLSSSCFVGGDIGICG